MKKEADDKVTDDWVMEVGQVWDKETSERENKMKRNERLD